MRVCKSKAIKRNGSERPRLREGMSMRTLRCRQPVLEVAQGVYQVIPI